MNAVVEEQRIDKTRKEKGIISGICTSCADRNDCILRKMSKVRIICCEEYILDENNGIYDLKER